MNGIGTPGACGMGAPFGGDRKREASPRPAAGAATLPAEDTATRSALHARTVKRPREDEGDDANASGAASPRRRIGTPERDAAQAGAVAVAAADDPPPLGPARPSTPLAMRAVSVPPEAAHASPPRVAAPAASTTPSPYPWPPSALDAVGWDRVRDCELFRIIVRQLPREGQANESGKLGDALKAWFRPGGAKPKVEHLRTGLAIVMRSLPCLPQPTHALVMDALVHALGNNAQVRREVWSILGRMCLDPAREPRHWNEGWEPERSLTAPRRIEMARLAAHAFGIEESQLQLDQFSAVSEVFEGSAIAFLEKIQGTAPAAARSKRGPAAPSSAGVTLERLVGCVAASHWAPALARAVTRVHAQRPIDAGLFERIVAAAVPAAADQPWKSPQEFLETLAHAVCPRDGRGWPPGFRRVLEAHWEAARGTPRFHTTSRLLFPLLQPHETREARLQRTVEAAKAEADAGDAARLLFGVAEAQGEHRQALREEMLRTLMHGGASADVLSAAVLEAATRWECPGPPRRDRFHALLGIVLAHCHALPPTTQQRLGAACAQLLATHAEASLMGAFAALSNPSAEQMRAWPALLHGYFAALLRLPPADGRLGPELARLVACQRAAADSKGAARPQPASAASVGLGLAARANTEDASALLRPLLKAMKDTPPAAASLLMQDTLEGLAQGGLPREFAQVVADELSFASRLQPPLPGFQAISDAARAAMGAERFAEVSALAGAFDAPVAALARPDTTPVRDGKAAIARLATLAGQVQHFAAASAPASVPPGEGLPPLPEVSPAHRRAAELWKALCAEKRLLADAPLSEDERRETGALLAAAAAPLQVFMQPDAAVGPIGVDATAAALQALAAFQTRRSQHAPEVWNADSMALAWRLGLHRMAPAEQDRVLGLRVDRLIELARTQPTGKHLADPILVGLFQVAAGTPGQPDTDRTALGQRLSAALRHLHAIAKSVLPLTSTPWTGLTGLITASAHAVDHDGAGLARHVFAAMPAMSMDKPAAGDAANNFACIVSFGLGADRSDRIAGEVAAEIARCGPAAAYLSFGLCRTLSAPSAQPFGRRLAPVLQVAATPAASEPGHPAGREMLAGLASFSRRTGLNTADVFIEAVRHLRLPELVRLYRMQVPAAGSPIALSKLGPQLALRLATTPPPGPDARSRDDLTSAEVFKLALAFVDSRAGATDEALRAAFEPAAPGRHREICMGAVDAARRPASILASPSIDDAEKIRVLRELLGLRTETLRVKYPAYRRQIFAAACAPALRIAALTALGHGSLPFLRRNDFSELRALVVDLLRQVPVPVPAAGDDRAPPPDHLYAESTEFLTLYSRMNELAPTGTHAAFVEREREAVRLSGLPAPVIERFMFALDQLRPVAAGQGDAAPAAQAVVPLD